MFITVLGQKEASPRSMKNEEVIEFCVDFIPDLKPIGFPESRHKGRLGGNGTLGPNQIICMDRHSLTEAHYTLL